MTTTIVRIPHFSGANLSLQQRPKSGQTVEKGDVICTIEFDAIGMDSQAEVDIEAEASGRIKWAIINKSEISFGEEVAEITS